MIESQNFGATVMLAPSISSATHFKHKRNVKSYSIIIYLKVTLQRIRAERCDISIGTLLQLITMQETDVEFFLIEHSRTTTCKTLIVIGVIKQLMVVILPRYLTTTAMFSFKMAKSTAPRISTKSYLLQVKTSSSK